MCNAHKAYALKILLYIIVTRAYIYLNFCVLDVHIKRSKIMSLRRAISTV